MSQPVQLARNKTKIPETYVDPVCKMLVTAETAAASYDYNGRHISSGAVGCKDRFAADPNKYLRPEPQTDLPQDVEYTCPMHPEIVQIGPGSCPICGMALEPEMVTLDDRPDPELST